MPKPLDLADQIGLAAEGVVIAAREFKNYPTVVTFARVLGAFAQLATVIKANRRPMREWLAGKDEKAR
jgi:hypothetical protein